MQMEHMMSNQINQSGTYTEDPNNNLISLEMLKDKYITMTLLMILGNKLAVSINYSHLTPFNHNPIFKNLK